MLPFWRPVFEQAGVEVSVVHVLRHPMAVALSLRKRGVSIERGLALWLEHVVRAREDVDPGWRNVTVEYPKAANYRGWIYRAGEVFDLPVPDSDASCFNLWVQSSLDHHPMGGRIGLPFVVTAVWDHLEQEMGRA